GRNVRNIGAGELPAQVPAAGKTGTTSDATDVWFVGFTPDLLAAVWFGFDRPTQITSTATGGGFAAPVWGEFMRYVYFGEPALLDVPDPWVLPEAIRYHRVDSETGMLANEWCPPSHVYVEKFAPGTVPSEVCDLHGPGGLRGAPLRGLFEGFPEALPGVDGGAPDSMVIDSLNPEITVQPDFPLQE
ncbi:MAG TPA: hypothetical protein VNZ57_06620, partial [Longimicrobiales bacterium]|nr:hypothetical protein [Longimicrobiales bacterium]